MDFAEFLDMTSKHFFENLFGKPGGHFEKFTVFEQK